MFETVIHEIISRSLQVHGLEIFQEGSVVFRHNFSPDVRYPIYSATKSFTSTAVGMASDEGKLSVDAPLYEFLEQKYRSYIPADQLDSFRQLTLKRFMTMSVPGYPFRPEGGDWLGFSLSLPVSYSDPPAFHYSNIPAYLAGIACENAVGQHLIDYLTPRLFEPLGIPAPVFLNCPQGHFYGASGMELTVHELSLLGQLYLQKGIWNGKRLLSEQWAVQAVSPQIQNRDGGYGYFFWTTNNSFRISGKWGQKCLIYPQKNRMITYLSHLPERSKEMLQIAESCICL